MKNRAGEYRNLTGELQYKSFVPNPLPPNPPIKIDEEMANLLAKANRNIGILEVFLGRYRILSFSFQCMCARKPFVLTNRRNPSNLR